jgi:hypothetical protein
MHDLKMGIQSLRQGIDRAKEQYWLARRYKRLSRERGAAFASYMSHSPRGLLGVPAVLARLEKSPPIVEPRWRDAFSTWLLACVFSFALIVGCTIPGVYALVTLPPDRAQFISQWILLATLLFMGVALGSATKHRGVVTPNFLQRWSIINLCRRLYCVRMGYRRCADSPSKSPSAIRI